MAVIPRSMISAITTAAMSATMIATRWWSSNQAPATAPIAQEYTAHTKVDSSERGQKLRCG